MSIISRTVDGVLKSSLSGLAIKALAAFSAFLMNLVVARALGPSESGVFFLGITFVVFSAAVGRMGLEMSAVRFVSRCGVGGNSGLVRPIARKITVWCFISSSSLALILYLMSTPISNLVFDNDDFSNLYPLLIISVPIVALYSIRGFLLNGLKRTSKALFVLDIVVPVSVVLGIVICSVSSAIDAILLYMVGGVISLGFGYYWWKKEAPLGERGLMFSSSELFASCLPLWGGVVYQQVILWSSQLLVGIWGTSEEVALIATAQRVALLVSFFLMVLNTVSAPIYSEIYTKGDWVNLRKTALWCTRIVVLTSVPIFIVVLALPAEIMGLFGAEFKNGALTLVILAFGQFVNIVTGSVGLLLTMSGHEKLLRRNLQLGALLAVVLGITFVPVFGIVGGAVATSAAISFQNLLGVYGVRRVLGFNTLAFWRRV